MAAAEQLLDSFKFEIFTILALYSPPDRGIPTTIFVPIGMDELIIEDSSSTSSCTEYLIRNDPQSDLDDIFEYLSEIYKINIYGYVLYHEDLSRLRDGQWINDKIINTYMRLVMNYQENAYIFSTYAYPMICKSQNKEACEWFSNVDLFSYEYIVFPIFNNSHWTLIIANEFLLSYYDSVGQLNMGAMDKINKFLIHVYRTQRGAQKKFVGRNMAKHVPFQENCDDCGVFCCMYARFAVDNKIDKLFTVDDIPKLRKRMLHEILSGEIIYSYDPTSDGAT